jgi:hypothetical protein
MEGIEFEENSSTGIDQSNQFKSRVIIGQPTKVGVIGFLVKKGLFKNETKAGQFLIIFAVVIFTASLGVFFRSNISNIFTPEASGPTIEQQRHTDKINARRESNGFPTLEFQNQ